MDIFANTDVVNIQGMKFTVVRGSDGGILRLEPMAVEIPIADSHTENFPLGSAVNSQSEAAEECTALNVKPVEMAPVRTAEIEEAVSASTTVASSTQDDVSSTGSDSFDLNSEDYLVDFPALSKGTLKKSEQTDDKTVESIDVDVCYMPVYRTLKKIQMRAGPGSKFPAVCVIPANTTVRVLLEGVDDCSKSLVLKWWSLHVNHNGRALRTPSKAVLNDRENESLEEWAERVFSEEEFESVKRHLRAADNKVKVAVEIDGEDRFGWISKRKKSGPMIQRIFKGDTPVVAVTNIGSLYNKNFLFANEVTKYKSTHGSRFPPMSFYKKLLKTISGCSKVEWEGEWRNNRRQGSEIVTIGNGIVRTGFYIPHDSAFLFFKSISKATSFIKNAETLLEDQDIEVDFERTFANLQPVSASACPFEHANYISRLQQQRRLEEETDEEFRQRARTYANIYKLTMTAL